MSFVNAIKSGYKDYLNFSGRTSRSGFWYFWLFQIVVGYIVGRISGGFEVTYVDGIASVSYQGGLLAAVWSLANIIPNLSVATRRLHDIDKSGWWQLLVCIPVIGWIILLIWTVRAGTPGDNRFGAPAA